MEKEKIKTAVAHLPHVKTVWVKNDEIFIHQVAGAVEHTIDQDIVKTKKTK